MISSLSVTNLLSSSVLLPLVVIDTISPDSMHRGVCRPMDAVAMFVITSSVFATVIIGVDKFCAIEDPLRYHAVMTPGRAALLVAVGWTVSLASATASTIGELRTRGWTVCQPRDTGPPDPHDFSDEYRDNRHWTSQRQLVVIMQVAMVLLLPLLLLAWIYLCISRAARRCTERARSRGQPPGPSEPTSGATSASEQERQPQQRPVVSTIRRQLYSANALWQSSEARAAKVSVSVVVLFACCYVPYFAVELVRVCYQRPFPSLYTHVSLIFVVSNAALAPFLYSLRAQNMQHEVLKLFERRMSAHSAPHSVHVVSRRGGGRRQRRIRENPLCRMALDRAGRLTEGGGRPRFDQHGQPTYARDSSMESSDWSNCSAMTGVTVISVENTELDEGPIQRV